MRWRFWVIELPAVLFDLWWLAYRWLLTLLIMATVSLTAASLVLRLFGIRWGW